MKRLLHLLQFSVIGAAIFLGALWPSLHTLVAIVVLPGMLLALAAIVKPQVVAPPRRLLPTYLTAASWLSFAALLLQTVWMLRSHSVPVDVVVPVGFAGPALVVYGVANGAPEVSRGGRRVYEIPPGRVLRTRFGPNDGWWFPHERRFFVKDQDELVEIDGHVRGSGVSTMPCEAHFETFVIGPDRQLEESVWIDIHERESWGVSCLGGRLTRR